MCLDLLTDPRAIDIDRFVCLLDVGKARPGVFWRHIVGLAS